MGLVSLVVIYFLAAWAFRLPPFGSIPASTETLPPTPTVGVPAASATPSIPDGTCMVPIPAGTYTVGRDPADNTHAALQQIELKSFYIDIYQTTNSEYGEYLYNNWRLQTNRLASSPPGEEKHPVRGITWEQADIFCKWKNKRLPTEGEWEVAGRGKSNDLTKPPRLYPWGDEAFLANQLPSDNTYEVDCSEI